MWMLLLGTVSVTCYIDSSADKQVHVEAGHFDGRAGGAEHFSVRLDRDWRLVIAIGNRAANNTDHVLVICRCIFRLLTIARTAGTKRAS